MGAVVRSSVFLLFVRTSVDQLVRGERRPGGLARGLTSVAVPIPVLSECCRPAALQGRITAFARLTLRWLHRLSWRHRVATLGACLLSCVVQVERVIPCSLCEQGRHGVVHLAHGRFDGAASRRHQGRLRQRANGQVVAHD